MNGRLGQNGPSVWYGLTGLKKSESRLGMPELLAVLSTSRSSSRRKIGAAGGRLHRRPARRRHLEAGEVEGRRDEAARQAVEPEAAGGLPHTPADQNLQLLAIGDIGAEPAIVSPRMVTACVLEDGSREDPITAW